jgi:hypothetical protein
MSGQQAEGPGSSGSPGRNGTTLHPPSVPFWASGSTGEGERRDAPAGFGRPERGGSSYRDPDNRESPYREGLSERAGTSAGPAGLERSGRWERTEAAEGTNVPAQREADTGSAPAPDLPAAHHPLRRGEISHLARDSRAPVWRRRLIIAVAVGVLFTIFTDWRIGLTLAVLAAIADAFISSRSTSGGRSQGLVSGAQRRTKKELDKLERSGYRSLHIREIPGTDQIIDHFLVGPTGVYAIDSEQWDKRLPVRTRNGRQLYHGPYSQKDRLQHAHWEAEQASDLIGNALGEHITVRPAMAVYGPSIPWGFATIRDVDVFGGDKLRKYLRRHRAGRDERLAPSEVERIYTAADKVLPAHR